MNDASVCLTVDFDAVSAWIHWGPSMNTPTNRSRGVFGADVGVPRLLDLFAAHDIETTWFVPGHTIESFPDACEAVVAAGHGINHHGWKHVSPTEFDSRTAERADLERGIAAIEDLTGSRPSGYRSPSWDLSTHTAGLLEDLGFAWDSSAMATEFSPYYLRADATADPDEPYGRGRKTDLLELPVSWHRDDFPALEFVPDRGFVDEASIFRMWRDGIDWLADRGEGVYVLTVHPQVIGRSHRLDRLDALLAHVRDRPDIGFSTAAEVVERAAGA